MRRIKDGDDVEYLFKVGSDEVQVSFPSARDSSGKLHRTVSFAVNDRYDMNRESISAERRNEISNKIFVALRHQLAQDEDAEYKCTAFIDGQEDFRALAYAAVGFSRPVGARPGAAQFAVVRGGKIDSAATRSRLVSREADSPLPKSPEEYDALWGERAQQINDRRNAARRARRAA